MFTRLNKLYHEFPPRFWIIVLTFFIDSVGGTLLFPFFSLYITQRFNVGMTQAGMVLAMFSIFGIVGNMLGGALTDRFGRRKLILFGLVFSALITRRTGASPAAIAGSVTSTSQGDTIRAWPLTQSTPRLV